MSCCCPRANCYTHLYVNVQSSVGEGGGAAAGATVGAGWVCPWRAAPGVCCFYSWYSLSCSFTSCSCCLLLLLRLLLFQLLFCLYSCLLLLLSSCQFCFHSRLSSSISSLFITFPFFHTSLYNFLTNSVKPIATISLYCSTRAAIIDLWMLINLLCVQRKVKNEGKWLSIIAVHFMVATL